MQQAMSMNKWLEVSNLKEGDKVKLTDGSIAIFSRLKQKNFVGTIDEKCYNIPVDMFEEIIEKAVIKLNKEYKTLKKGELFYIKQKSNAVIFKFEEIINGRIIGINPIDNCRTRIDVQLYGGRVADL